MPGSWSNGLDEPFSVTWPTVRRRRGEIIVNYGFGQKIKVERRKRPKKYCRIVESNNLVDVEY